MEAIFAPRDIEKLPIKLIDLQGKSFVWDFAFEMDGKKYYECNNVNFVSGLSFSEKDLKAVEQ